MIPTKELGGNHSPVVLSVKAEKDLATTVSSADTGVIIQGIYGHLLLALHVQ